MADITKPSSAEEEYFAREEAEKKRKLALDEARKLEATKKDDLKQLHHMRCPKCGMQLQAVRFKGIEVDRCFHCGVTVFDAGELEKIGVHEKEGIVGSLLRVFK